MRLRTRVALACRAVAALALQTGLVLAVGAVVGGVGAAVGVAGAGLVGDVVGWTPLSLRGAALAALAGAGLFTAVWAADVRKRLRRGRRGLVLGTRDPERDDEGERAAVETVRRLAAQVAVPVPEVRVRDADDPLCYTVPGRDGAILVVSTGLLTALPPAEREAVLAHEVAHVANRDHGVTRWALAPLVAAEELADTADDDRGQRAFYGALVAWGAVGVGVFSRGREFAADAAAARLTGDPAALAGALSRLDGATADPPETDLREHATSVDALSVLPALSPSTDAGGGLAATHPATETRVDRLRALEARIETAN